MALLQKKLRTDLPYGKVYQGTGEMDPKDKDCKFYQHGLYFDAKGDLLTSSPHNAERIALITRLEGNPDEPKEVVQQEDSAAVNPEIVAALDAMDDEAVQNIAVNLTRELAKTDPPTDYGDYAPSVENRDANIRFIAKYTTS